MARVEGTTINSALTTAMKNSGFEGVFEEAITAATDSVNRTQSQLLNFGDSSDTGIAAIMDSTLLAPNGTAGISLVRYDQMEDLLSFFVPDDTISNDLNSITGDTNTAGSNFINIGLGSPEAISNTLNKVVGVPVAQTTEVLKGVADNLAVTALNNIESTFLSGLGFNFVSKLSNISNTFKQLTNGFSNNLVQDVALKSDNSYRNQIINLGVDDPEVVDEILTLIINNNKEQAIDRTIQYLEEKN